MMMIYVYLNLQCFRHVSNVNKNVLSFFKSILTNWSLQLQKVYQHQGATPVSKEKKKEKKSRTSFRALHQNATNERREILCESDCSQTPPLGGWRCGQCNVLLVNTSPLRAPIVLQGIFLFSNSVPRDNTSSRNTIFHIFCTLSLLHISPVLHISFTLPLFLLLSFLFLACYSV